MRRKRTQSIEPKRSANEYIDDLPIDDDGPYYVNPNEDMPRDKASASSDIPSPSGTTQPVERASVRPATVVGLLCLLAAGCTGWSIAALQYTVFGDHKDSTARQSNGTSAHQSSTEPAPTVTITKTVTELPLSCQQALADFDKYLDAASAVGAANNQQLDIIGKATQAILLKDWKMLGEASDDQRNLERSLGPAASKVLPVLITVKKGMEKCRSDAS